jgi:hypothetical protein
MISSEIPGHRLGRRRRRPLGWPALVAVGAVAIAAVAGIVYAVWPSGPSATPAAAVRGYAGSLLLDASGSQLVGWNKTSSYCGNDGISTGNGSVAADSSGDAALTTTGQAGSCVGIISPDAYSSGVIEADIDFPALPGQAGTIANWTSFWLTDEDTWPVDGELDAVEAAPVNGKNAVSWHSGPDESSVFVASTDSFHQVKLPTSGPNLKPGWHVVDIVYTKGSFAVYYDGREFTRYTSTKVTGSALNILLTSTVTPDSSAAESLIGGPPVNSDHSPATIGVKYIRAWSYK